MANLTEYPRPQLVRDSYKSLNTKWKYCKKKDSSIPLEYDGYINVPYSIETSLSGVCKKLLPGEYLFYNLTVDITDDISNDLLILHFGAVDQICDVYINNNYVGSHEGGCLPFEFEISKYIINKKIDIVLRVVDYTDTKDLSRGKQKLKRGGIWYTSQSGIYMPVWLEGVSKDYIKNIKITPDIDDSSIILNVSADSLFVDLDILNKNITIPANEDVTINVSDMILWSPENPYLYYFKAKTKNDCVKSYFAMRKFSLVRDENNILRLGLNNKPYFMKGLLDQGYYSEGLMTPRSDKDYYNDITLAKKLGFNTLRKHIKIESMRFYYYCDTIGMIVWQDFVNGGSKYNLFTIGLPVVTGIHFKDNKYSLFGRKNADGRIKAIEEFKDTIKLLYNVPSIALWTIFNEGWGQFDSKEIYNELLKLDNTRLYDHASGWHDQGVSDTKSLHVYFKRVRLPNKKRIGNRAVILSECGGYSLAIKNHMFSKRVFGYKIMKNAKALEKEYEKFINRDILPNIKNGLSAFIYTELSDIEDELNGFVTFDREVVKVSEEFIKMVNSKVKL